MAQRQVLKDVRYPLLNKINWKIINSVNLIDPLLIYSYQFWSVIRYEWSEITTELWWWCRDHYGFYRGSML